MFYELTDEFYTNNSKNKEILVSNGRIPLFLALEIVN